MSLLARLTLILVFMVVCVDSGAAVAAEKSDAILLVAFGTSTDAGQRSYGNIEKKVKAAFPETPVYWAFTSGMIRKKLAGQGRIVLSPGAALQQIHKDGIKNVVVQSLHIATGQEFHELLDEVGRVRHQLSFERVTYGRPLLFSKADLEASMAAILASFKEKHNPDEALLLMGHGNEHGHGDLTFIALSDELSKKDSRVFMATVEGCLKLEDLLVPLRDSGAKTVRLAPFMVVAGDHAQNDLCGEEADSWKSILEKEGYVCRCDLVGLGEIDAIADIFVQHLKHAREKR